MKAKIPRAWQGLPTSQRKSIEEYARKVANDQMEKDGRIMIDLYIKMVCYALHEAFGFGELRLSRFLSVHHRLFWEQKNLVSNGTQLDFLNSKMAEIFRRNGFPQMLFDEMLGEVPESQGGK